MVDMNINNRMITKLIEVNNFEPVTLTREELCRDMDIVIVTTTLDDDAQSMTFSFKKLQQEV